MLCLGARHSVRIRENQRRTIETLLKTPMRSQYLRGAGQSHKSLTERASPVAPKVNPTLDVHVSWRPDVFNLKVVTFEHCQVFLRIEGKLVHIIRTAARPPEHTLGNPCICGS